MGLTPSGTESSLALGGAFGHDRDGAVARDRDIGLDVLRFCAALAVVVFHYKSKYMESMAIPAAGSALYHVTKFGYLGVDLFFLISGYVIFNSALGRTAFEFAVSRGTRIFPTLWLCMSLSIAGAIALEPDPRTSVGQWVADLLLANRLLGLDFIDGVYWTLVVELKFYSCVFALIVLGWLRHYRIWLPAWLFCTGLFMATRQPFFIGWFVSPEYSAYFIAGIAFALVRREGPRPGWIALIAATLPLAMIHAYRTIGEFTREIDSRDRVIAAAAVAALYAIMYVLSRRAFAWPAWLAALSLGGITYPLYLLHNRLGKDVYDAAGATASPGEPRRAARGDRRGDDRPFVVRSRRVRTRRRRPPEAPASGMAASRHFRVGDRDDGEPAYSGAKRSPSCDKPSGESFLSVSNAPIAPRPGHPRRQARFAGSPVGTGYRGCTRPMPRLIVACLLTLALALGGTSAVAGIDDTQRIALVGASIGKAWQIDQLPARMTLPDKYQFEYQGINAFDKSALIQGLVNRRDKPDAIMIKECATYFPGRLADYQKLEKDWIATLRAAGIQPILVTTAPLAEPRGTVQRAKDVVKKLIGRPTWQDTVLEFNDWLKAYAKAEHIALFDLEAVLRTNDTARWLRPEFDDGDGLHLNRAAYQAVDQAFARFLAERKRGAR